MMGTKQKLKTAAEIDFIYARGMYCYLANSTKAKKNIKRGLSKRRRKEAKIIVRKLLNEPI